MAPVSVVDILRTAVEQVGKPYRWDAEGPDAFDCSGLVRYVYGRHGIDLPSYTGSLLTTKNAVPIDPSEIQPGDLVFVPSRWEYRPDAAGRTGPYPSGHVAIYAGNDTVIEAAGTKEGVVARQWSKDRMASIDAARRPIGVTLSEDDRTWLQRIWDAGGNLLDFLWGIPGQVGKLNPIDDLVRALSSVGKFFDAMLWLTNPANWARLIVGSIGGILILYGAIHLGREARDL